jgi:hypothetical protein
VTDFLLDVNVLIALSASMHIHHESAQRLRPANTI